MVAVDVIRSPTSRAWRAPSSVATIVALVSSRTPVMITLIDSVDRTDRSASLRTSAATTAKPLPASPARAASMAAFSASRFVCAAISLISSTISPIFCARSPSESARAAIASTFSRMSRMVSPVRSAALAISCALSAIEPAAVARSSIVADVCATADDCWLATASAFLAASRSSPETSPSTAEVERIRARRLFSWPSAALSCSSRWPPRRSNLIANSETATPASTARIAAPMPTPVASPAAELAAAWNEFARAAWAASSASSGRCTLVPAVVSREMAATSRGCVVPPATSTRMNSA